MVPKKKSARAGDTPGELKTSLDRIDREIVQLLTDRAKAYQKFRKLTDGKQADGVEHSPYDYTADAQTIASAIERNKGPLTEPAVRAVFREIVSGCRAIVSPQRVSFLGPLYSYSHLATIECFGQSVELVPVGTIAGVFEEVTRNHTEFGLVPIENSTDGRVADTLDMLARTTARICGEVQLRIHHNLLAKCPRGEVNEVYSKPQALSQCRDWLAKHLPGARIIEMASTSTAAQIAAEKPGAAAIASSQAGSHYGLDIVAANIEDNRHNITRFAVIGRQPAARTGHDKTSLLFHIGHRPGALAEAMNVFKRARLNLTWIESFPMSGQRQEYLFIVELEGHQNDTRVRKAIDALARKADKVEVLGSYARTEPLD